MKRIALGLFLAALFTAPVLTLFGDDLRRRLGQSADSLAGDDRIHAADLTRKTMRNFGPDTFEAAIAPSPLANTHAHLDPHGLVDARQDRLSTFAVDVDTASYTLGRRVLRGGALPVPDSVRVEEWVNAFEYALPQPGDLPFSVTAEGAPSPFNAGRTVLKVSLQGRRVANADRLPAHLVFLVDTSGSMQGRDRLPLAQEALRILVKNLNPRDTVALITYAGSVREVLPPTSASRRVEILEAIDALTAGGGTAMGDGMELAYRHAVRFASPDSVSRVIVLTDGDANIGRSLSAEAMLAAVHGYVKEGVTLTTVGFGMGNYRDHTLEQLADRGNGQSLYIDSREQAVKVFQTQIAGTLEVIARDVKVQVEFDAQVVRRYRLLGYENRDVADRDFTDDEVDGGEIGAGHSVTAVYELELSSAHPLANLGTVRVRGQRPRSLGAFESALELEPRLLWGTLESASSELRFAVAVAGAADLLRGNGGASPEFTLAQARALAASATRDDPDRLELVSLLDLALHGVAPGVAVAPTPQRSNVY